MKSIIQISILFLFYTISAFSQYYHENVDLNPNLIPFPAKTKYGYMNRNKEIIIEAQFDRASFFSKKGVAIVRKGRKYFYIDTLGNTLLETGNNNTMFIKLSKKSTKINFDIIANKYQSKWRAVLESGVVSRVYVNKPKYYYSKGIGIYEGFNDFYSSYKKVINTDSMTNFIDIDGHEVFDEFFIDGIKLSDGYFGIYNEQKKIALFDSTGKQISPYIFSNLQASGLKGYFIFHENSLSGLINIKGIKIIETKYDFLKHLFGKYFIAGYDYYGVKGVINIKNEIIIPFEYDKISPLGNNLIWLKKGRTHKIIDTLGNLINGTYEYCESLDDESKDISSYLYCNIFSDSTLYVLDSKGEEILKLKNPAGKIKKGFDNQFIISGPTMRIYNTKGDILIDGDYTSIDTTNIKDLYIVKRISCNRIEGGLYSSKIGWITDSLSHYYFYLSYDKDKYGKYYWIFDQDDQKILIHGSINKIEKINKENEAIRVENYNDNICTIIYNNVSYNYPCKGEFQYEYNKGSLYFWTGYGDEKEIFDTNLKKIIPEGFQLHNTFNLETTFVFIVIDKKNETAGLIDINGKWLIKPEKEIRITKLDKKFFYVAYEDVNDLYNAELKKLNKKRYHMNYQYIINGLVSAIDYKTNKLDIINETGEILSEGKYNKYIGRGNDYFVVSKSPNREIQCCILDTLAREIRCFNFENIRKCKGLDDRFIATDLYEEGVVNKELDTIIPFNYSYIKYYPKYKIFIGSNIYFENDVVYDINGNVIIKGMFKDIFSLEDSSDIKAIQFENKICLFNEKNQLVGKIKINKNYFYNHNFYKKLFDIGLFPNFYYKNRRFYYSDFKTGIDYVKDTSLIEK